MNEKYESHKNTGDPAANPNPDPCLGALRASVKKRIMMRVRPLFSEPCSLLWLCPHKLWTWGSRELLVRYGMLLHQRRVARWLTQPPRNLPRRALVSCRLRMPTMIESDYRWSFSWFDDWFVISIDYCYYSVEKLVFSMADQSFYSVDHFIVCRKKALSIYGSQPKLFAYSWSFA